MLRVQRTEKLSAGRLAAGAPAPQLKLISLSCRTTTAVPDKVLLLKYSPRQVIWAAAVVAVAVVVGRGVGVQVGGRGVEVGMNTGVRLGSTNGVKVGVGVPAVASVGLGVAVAVASPGAVMVFVGGKDGWLGSVVGIATTGTVARAMRVGSKDVGPERRKKSKMAPAVATKNISPSKRANTHSKTWSRREREKFDLLGLRMTCFLKRPCRKQIFATYP